ncbi:uncharacterized protein tara isoform X2 [Calliphora vicina]|uniref:uncharacterized protein tara isoform X2 n=1 Tax=Calliphora vicina TaxID=7373 RepID=UPI00325C2A67
MCTEVNSAMGLQATTATKRKHDLTFDSKDTNTYTNCPPPIKTSKWSLNNNNYIDAVGEQKLAAVNGIKTNNSNNNNNNNNNENKRCDMSCGTISYNLRNGKEVLRTKVTSVKPVLNAIVANIPVAGEVDATTPLPPTSSTLVPEDSIAKLEVVASVPWTSAPEPVDCISKLQAVAVPSDPWGSISTRSTLATTLLSADELDDDDDDFEDDYEEEESIIPTYCPLRYHTFPSANSPSSSSSASPSPNHQNQRMGGSFTTSQSYGSRPNYYSEPFPQQNCSRTGSPQHLRVGNGFTWPNGNNSSFYASPESAYTSPQQQQHAASQQQHQPQVQQQTIRCAENGKSYLELGCTSPVPNVTNNTVPAPSPTPFVGLHVAAPAAHEARLPLKRCCDGRGSWCGSNKTCYKDIRLKIRNLSMFKLSRFRQVSEQSLYRSVLICNTLKRIDREIEAEAKELHQAAAHVAQQHHNHLNHSTTTAHHQPQSQYHHHLHSHMQIQSPLPSHNNSNNGHHHQLPQQQQHHSQQPMLHPQHQDYMPVPNCGRLGGNVEYQNHQQQQQQQSAAQQNFHQHHYQNERMESSPFQNSLQKPAPTSQFLNNHQSSNNCTGSVTTTLHPYDHYPFRETHSGRATPYPSQPVISLPPVSASASPSSSSQVQSSVTSPATNTTAVSTASSITSDTDSGYADDDSTRSINWSSVLSLSSQSALDPLNNNDLFSILPPANPATAVPVSIPSSSSTTNGSETSSSSSSSMAVAISGTFTTVQSSSASSPAATSSLCNTSTIPPSATTTATFTTLSTISSATHSLTSSYVSSMSSNLTSAASTWEYGFLDMEFGLGTEFTELAPSCKLSADDFGFKNSLTPVTVTRYDNELEQPAHIMVGS